MTGDRFTVLFIIDSLEPAGAEVSTVAMLEPLARIGVTSRVVHFGRHTELAERASTAAASVDSLGPGNRAKRLQLLRRTIARHQPDLVHTTLFESDVAGRPAARLAGVPVVSSLVSTAYDPDVMARMLVSERKLKLARALDRTTARLVRRFHAISDTAARHGIEHLGIDRSRIEVIPRGRSGEGLGRRTPDRRQAVRRAMGWGDDSFIVLAVARHEPPKALDVMLDAMTDSAIPPSARLVVAGREGTATARLEDQAHRLQINDRVDWLGVRSDVADLMVGADVLVLPSRWEGLGSTLIEALALELPIVASRLPAIEEITPNGEFALLVEPGDAGELAAALAQTRRDPSEARTRAARGRIRFEERYEIGTVAEQMAAFYRRALISR
jgi:glycosyltransferase involved in cell wall biosynthesis